MAQTLKELVVRIGADAAQLDRELRQSTRELRQFERAADRIGGTLTRALTLPLAAIGGVATAAGVSIDNAFADIRRATGATGEALKGLQNDFRAVFRQVPQSADQVATALSELNTRLGLTGTALQQVTRQVLDFARVNEQDVATATRDVGQLINALGIDARQASRLLDQLTFTSQQTGANVGELTRAIIEAGPAFEEMGFGVEESIALFGQFERVGARPQEVVSSLNMALTRLARSGATNARTAFAQLLTSIRDAPDILSAVTIAADAFGSRVGAKVAEDIRAGLFEVDRIVESLQQADGTLRSTAEESLKFGEMMGIMRNRTAEAVEALGTDLLDAFKSLMSVVEGGVDLLASTVRWFSELPQPVRHGAIAMGTMLAIAGPLTIAVAKLTTTITALATAKAALGSVLIPGGVVLVGLGALATAFLTVETRARAARIEAERSVAALRQSFATMDLGQLEKEAERIKDEFLAASAQLEEVSSGAPPSPEVAAVMRRRGLIPSATKEYRDALAEATRLAHELNAVSVSLEEARARAAGDDDETVIPGTSKGSEERLKRITQAMEAWRAQLATTSFMARQFGDEFDEAAAQIAATEAALRSLLAEGLDESDVRVQDLTQSLKDLRAGQRMVADSEREWSAALQEAASIIEQTLTPMERYQRQLERINELHAMEVAGVPLLTAEQRNRAIKAAQEELERLTEETEDILDRLGVSAQMFGRAFTDAIADAVTSGRASFESFFQFLTREVKRLAVRFAAFHLLTGAGVGAPLVTALTGMSFGGPRAGGGPVRPDRYYMVGEQGPEMFVPGASGFVQPVPAMAGAGGGARPITVNVPQARSPIDFARDQDWIDAIAETNRQLEADGFAFGGGR